MWTRRSINLALVGVTALGPSMPVGAQTTVVDDPPPPLPTDLKAFAEDPDFFSLELENEPLGTASPTQHEQQIADELLNAAPKNTRPIEVARYWRDMGQGKYGAEYAPFARGWPVRYNPVIIAMFKATQTNPLDPGLQGDATPWCAAFVNYCIARAISKDGTIGDRELSFGTHSASSGSFRCWPTPEARIEEPKHGCVIVWALEGTVNECKHGKGHVGFYEGPGDSEKPLLTLGGNTLGKALPGTETRRDGIILKKMPVRYAAGSGHKEWHSFRMASFL